MARGAHRARALIACAIGALALLNTADAQTRTAAQAERDRRAETQRAERLRNQANGVRREIRELDQRLTDAARRRAEAEAAATAAEERLATLRAQMSVDEVRRRQSRDALERALIRAAFAARRVEPHAVRSGIAARALAPALAQDQRRSSEALAAARATEAATAAEQSIIADAQDAIDAERAEIVSLMARRRAAQTELANSAAAADRRARTLAAEARSLRELAARVQPASRRNGAGGGSGPSSIPATWLAPAEGRIARGFGVRDGAAPATQGVTLATRTGAQVVAPATSEVAYAGVFRSYGHVLILNVDGGYAIVLTGLETISVSVGERVRAGQPVGVMSAAATAAPELYVEVRRDGQPVDPGRWLVARGLAAVQGVRAGG
jgi:septal ring factor EnvC (AmiA/AmiB activator)